MKMSRKCDKMKNIKNKMKEELLHINIFINTMITELVITSYGVDAVW